MPLGKIINVVLIVLTLVILIALESPLSKL